MDTSFADKVVVVTGASQGIGEAVAKRFAEEGARLVLSEMTDEVPPSPGRSHARIPPRMQSVS